MFNEHSILKDVNIFVKIFSYILVIIALFMCREELFLIFIDVILILITKNNKKLFITSLILLGITILNLFYPHILWISKLIIFTIYTILLKKITKVSELRYVLENTLYRFKTKKITYKILYISYFIKRYKNNLKKLYILKDDYDMKLSFKLIIFIIKKAYYKTKLSMNDFIETNKIRFYNFYNKRTYIEKIKWESWDTNYITIHVIIFLATCFYGR